MDKSRLLRINAIKIILLLVSTQILASCASGSAIVTGTKRDAINPETVKLYLKEPANYEVVAIVKASSDAGWTEQGSQDYAVKELKKQAAKLGANGVLIGATGEKTTTMIGGYSASTMYAIPIDAQIVSGHAIYVFGE